MTNAKLDPKMVAKKISSQANIQKANAANKARREAKAKELENQLNKIHNQFENENENDLDTKIANFKANNPPSLASDDKPELSSRDIIRLVKVFYVDGIAGDNPDLSDIEFAKGYSKYDLPDDETIIETFYAHDVQLPFGYLALCSPLDEKNRERNVLLCKAICKHGGTVPDYYKPIDKRHSITEVPQDIVFAGGVDPNPKRFFHT